MSKIRFKIKFFFDVLVKSLTKFDFYNEIKKTKLSFSLKYLFFLFYLTSLVGSIFFAVSLSAFVLPKVPSFISTLSAKANSFYPEGLEVNIKDGKVTTNQKEPYYISTLDSLGLSKNFDHLITINTKADPSNIKDEKTAVLITKDSVVTMESDSSYKVYPIDTKANYKIDKDVYTKLVSQVLPYLRYIEPGIIVIVIILLLIWPFIGAAFSMFWELIYLLIFSAVFFLVLKIMKKELAFKKLYQLTIHAATLPILLGLVVSSLGIQMPPFLGSAILFVYMILVVNHLR